MPGKGKTNMGSRVQLRHIGHKVPEPTDPIAAETSVTALMVRSRLGAAGHVKQPYDGGRRHRTLPDVRGERLLLVAKKHRLCARVR